MRSRGESATNLVAQVVVATGISPNDILDCDPWLFDEIVRVLVKRSQP